MKKIKTLGLLEQVSGAGWCKGHACWHRHNSMDTNPIMEQGYYRKCSSNI